MMIEFTAKPYKIDDWLIVRLPKDASARLPSRGQVMVSGTMNGQDIKIALEPDGRGGHWFSADATMPTVVAGEAVELNIEATKDWTEPDVPADIAKGIGTSRKAQDIWVNITPMARREWIRWIRATNNLETRKKHIDVARSKMEKGMRRPCCFNASMCTVPEVSKSGVLLEPATTTI